MVTLAQRVSALPQELFDEIFELVFTPDDSTRMITSRRCPPAQLQVNRATRERFAEAYYGNDSVFDITYYIASYITKAANLASAVPDIPWIAKIPTAHFDKVLYFKVMDYGFDMEPVERARLYHAVCHLGLLLECFEMELKTLSTNKQAETAKHLVWADFVHQPTMAKERWEVTKFKGGVLLKMETEEGEPKSRERIARTFQSGRGWWFGSSC